MTKWERSARKKLERAKRKRNQRKTLYPFGFEYKKERYKVWKAKIVYENSDVGKTIDDKLTIACNEKSIKILEIQKEGKSRQLTDQFLLGNKIKQGESIT